MRRYIRIYIEIYLYLREHVEYPCALEALREEQIMASEHIQAIVLTDKIFTDIHSSLQAPLHCVVLGLLIS